MGHGVPGLRHRRVLLPPRPRPRPHRAGSGGRGQGFRLVAGLEPGTGGVQEERDHVVLTHEHGDFDQLCLVVIGGECGPGGCGQACVPVQFVGGTQQTGVGRCPPPGVRARADPPDLLVGDPGVPGQRYVPPPFVTGPRVARGAQDQQFPGPVRQPAPAQQMAAERQEALEEARVPHQGGEDVGEAAVGIPGNRGEQLPGGAVPAVLGQWREAGAGVCGGVVGSLMVFVGHSGLRTVRRGGTVARGQV